MNVYQLEGDPDNYEGLIMTDGDLFEFARRFNGKPMERPWTDVTIGIDPDTRSFPEGDFPSLIGGVPVFSPKAVGALRDMLVGNGEILPVTIVGRQYFLYNVTCVVDALDEKNSEIIRFTNSSRVLNIDEYAFFPKKLSGKAIFKIPQLVDGWIFVTDLFVKRVQSAGLKGFWFPVVWSDED
jgi:hypothetical protein